MSFWLSEEYQELLSSAKEKGLFERTYGFYALYSCFILAGVFLSFYLIVAVDAWYIQLLNAIFLAGVFLQAGMLGHDLSHLQVFKSYRRNRFWASVAFGLIGGLSESKWHIKHNEHHVFVNQIGKDPDIDIPFLFSKKQHDGQSNFHKKWIMPYQHMLFFLALPFVYLGIISYSLMHIFEKFSLHTLWELILIAVHFSVLFYFPFAYLDFWLAAAFMLLHMLTGGLYMSLVFAPNHKGQEILEGDAEMTWKNQVISTRNIPPSQFVFYLFGGLNFQIEHHLFSNMSRLNYWKARPLVKAYCEKKGVPYEEVTWLESLATMYRTLKEVREIKTLTRTESFAKL